jgi:hypothetical protein
MISPVSAPGASSVRLYLTLTGDSKAANDYVVVSVDGESPVRRRKGQGETDVARLFVTKAVSAGTHEVRTWREDLTGKKIPASELTFRYLVGEPTAAPARVPASPAPDPCEAVYPMPGAVPAEQREGCPKRY